MRNTPLSRGTARLARTAFMLPCGPGWATGDEARAWLRARGREDGEAFECPLANCPKWHARSKPVPVRAVPMASGRDTGPGRKTRLAVYERDGWACACCGFPVADRPHSVGHRKRRSQGGGNQMSNLLTFLGLGRNPLDPDDHHARIDSRRRASDEANGYTVRSYQDPALVAVKRPAEGGGLTREWLTDDGQRVKEAPEGAAA